jgi:trehalose-6-phosphate synthase
VTPLRDGMNLVAKEYIAAQDPDDPGVLILSRFAGAAAELTAALLVNPYDPESVATSIAHALSMSLDERRARHQAMFRVISENDLKSWGDCFLGALTKETDLQLWHEDLCGGAQEAIAEPECGCAGDGQSEARQERPSVIPYWGHGPD